MADFGYTLYGAKELDANLKTLPNRVQKNVIKKGLTSSQRILLARAKQMARSLPNKWPKDKVDMSILLAKSMEVHVPKMRDQRSGQFSVFVRMKRGVEAMVHVSKAGKRSYIPNAIEYGHMSGSTWVPPIPFMRPAAFETTSSRMSNFAIKLRSGLLQEAIKNRK